MDGLDKSKNESTDQNGQSGLGSDVRRMPASGLRREVRISSGLPSMSRTSDKASSSAPRGLGAKSSVTGLPRLGDSQIPRVSEHISSTFQRPKQPSHSIVRPAGVRDESEQIRAIDAQAAQVQANNAQAVQGNQAAQGNQVAQGNQAAQGNQVAQGHTIDIGDSLVALNQAKGGEASGAKSAGEMANADKPIAEGTGDDDATVSVSEIAVDKVSGKISGIVEHGKLNESGEISADPNFGDVPMATLPVGMKIDDRYEILGVLGVGGFATVYRAHHLTIDRDVALKVMDLKKGVDPSYSERFFREAKIAAKIHHNNVVSIYDFGHVAETGQPYIAMEMLHGHDLSHELSKNGPLSPNRAFVLFRPVLDALSEGHRLGIVHKDLKPENLYLVDPGGPRELMKILDFGVARINSSEVAKLTSAGQLLGTPRYLAPEYITSQNVSPAIDVYQMALILSEALTGVPAVSGDPFHAMMLHCSGQIQISDFLLNGPVGEVFKKAIAIEPTERYENCAAFGAALDTVADYFASETPLKGGAPQRTPDVQTTPKNLPPLVGYNTTGNYAEPGLSADTAQPRQSNALRNVFIALLAVVCAAGGAYFVYVKSKTPEPVDPPVVAEKPDPKVKFNFTSTPSGAQVTRSTRTVCVTPCSTEFKLSELRDEFKPLIVFKLDGYVDKDIEITEEIFKSHNGKIDVALDKIAPKKLPFKLNYVPKNATVIDADSGEVVCKLSPCTYTFSDDQVAVTLTFSAPDYLDKNVALTESDFSDDPIMVELEKRHVAPAKRPRPAKAEAAAAPPTVADEAPKHVKKEKEAPKPQQPTIKTMF